MKKLLVVASIAALVSSFSAQSADATFNLTLTVGAAPPIFIVDGGAGDADAAVNGNISFTGAAGGFTVSILASISNAPGGTVASLNTALALFAFPVLPATPVSLFVTDDTFTAPGGSVFLTGVFTASNAISPSATSTADTVGAVSVVQGVGTAFSGFGIGPPSTLTQTITGTTGIGPVTSFGLVSTLAVPEPSSMALLAIGATSILGYGARRRRKEKQKDPVA